MLEGVLNVNCLGAGHGLFIIKMSYSDGVISESGHLYALSLDTDSCEWQRWPRIAEMATDTTTGAGSGSAEPRDGPGPESSRKLVLLQQTCFPALYISITITLVTGYTCHPVPSPAAAVCDITL